MSIAVGPQARRAPQAAPASRTHERPLRTLSRSPDKGVIFTVISHNK